MVASLPRMAMDQKKIAQAKIRKDILSYLTIKSYMHLLNRIPSTKVEDRMASLNNALVYDQMGNPSSVRINKVVADVRKYLKETNKTNAFIQEFIRNHKVTAKSNEKLINSIETRNFVKLDPRKVEELQGAFLELLLDDKTKMSAVHLIHYLMVTGGLQNRFGSFIQIIPPILMDQYLGSSTEVKELFARYSEDQTKQERDAEFNTVFGMTFEEIGKDLMKWFESSVDVHYTTTIKQKGASVINAPNIEHDIETVAIDWKAIQNRNKIVSNNPKTLYIIPDTVKQDGYGTELEALRNNENVISIPVKKQSEGGYYSNDDLAEAQNEIDKAISEIEDSLSMYDKIAFPKDGLGLTKRYKLNEASEIFEYLNAKLKEKFGYSNATKKA